MEIRFKKNDFQWELPRVLEHIKGLDEEKEYILEIKQYRRKRSLNANNLCWKLCTEIADILRTDKDSVYLTMLKRYGQSDIVSVVKGIDVKPYFKYYEEAGEGRVNGKDFIHYKVFKGSSEYDTREMSIFLDGVVSEAKEMDIEVLTARELSLLKEEWGR